MFLVILINIGKIFLVIFMILLLVLYFHFQKKYKYWRVRNVPYAEPTFPLGNITKEVEKSSFVFFKKLYDESKYKRYYGIWLLYKPVLMINDPDLIQRILIRNFSHFNDTGNYFDKDNNPFAETLFALQGEKWKNLRAKLSPIFSSGKLKSMVPLLLNCSDNFVEVLEKPAQINNVIDVKELTKRYTIEVVLSVVFGVECDFMRNPKSTVGLMAADIFKADLFTMVKFFCALFIPDIARLFKYTITEKKVSDFFIKIFRDIVDYREKYNFTRKDVMQLLIELYKKGHIEGFDSFEKEKAKKEKFTFKHLSSQALTFLAGGFETTSTTMQFALYELAMNPEVQETVRKEIKEILARHNGDITFEAIFEMEYLGRTIEETLRKYSIAPGVVRKCTANFKDPCSDLIIEKDAYVLIPISGLHWDERYYPNPEKFDPDRFTEENKMLRPNCVYLPFGEGPRYCIGKRFAELKIRVALIVLLSKFRFGVSHEFTPKKLRFDPRSLVTTAKGQTLLTISLADE